MLNRLFPKQFDNTYRGYRLAIWLFVPYTALNLLIGTNSIINTRSVAISADGIPLDSFGAAGAQGVLTLFALLSLCHLMLALQSVVVLIRYRAMLPFMYFLLLLETLGRKVLLASSPVVKSGAATIGASWLSIGAVISYGMLAILVVGFVLSLAERDGKAARSAKG